MVLLYHFSRGPAELNFIWTQYDISSTKLSEVSDALAAFHTSHERFPSMKRLLYRSRKQLFARNALPRSPAALDTIMFIPPGPIRIAEFRELSAQVPDVDSCPFVR